MDLAAPRNLVWLSLAACLMTGLNAGAGAAAVRPDGVKLELSPRVCLMASDDKQCQTMVHAQWRSPQAESLCLVIVDRPGIKRCWEHYSEGRYDIELTFSDDLTFQLRDIELRQVLASTALRVIREAVRLRHRRRQPWNIFD
jgi:Protein of unknown function (DUF3019)